MNNIHHCVVSNKHDHPVLKQIQRDSIDLGWNKVVVLGNSSMLIRAPDYLGRKLILLKEYLDTLPDTDIVLFTDAHDVRVISTPQEILKKFLSFECGIVVSAEKNCWPNEYLVDVFTKIHPTTLNRHINSGGYIGYVKDLKYILADEDVVLSETLNDQDAFTFLYLKYYKHSQLIKLDTQCKIFQCLHMAHGDIDTEKRQNKVTLEYPSVWHGNGYGAVGDPIFREYVSKWTIVKNPRMFPVYKQQEAIELLVNFCESKRQINHETLEQIIEDYSENSVVQYLVGMYYKGQNNWYYAVHHFKKSMKLYPMFSSPVFEFTDMCFYLFKDYACETHLERLFNQETVKNPLVGQKTYDISDQLRVCSTLAPYYEKIKRFDKAQNVFQCMYDKLSNLKNYDNLSEKEKQIYSTCWKNICNGLERVSTSNDKKQKYLRESLLDYETFLKKKAFNFISSM